MKSLRNISILVYSNGGMVHNVTCSLVTECSYHQVDDVRVEVILQSQHAPTFDGRLTILTGADLMPSADTGDEPPEEDDEVYAAGGVADQEEDMIGELQRKDCIIDVRILTNVLLIYL